MISNFDELDKYLMICRQNTYQQANLITILNKSSTKIAMFTIICSSSFFSPNKSEEIEQLFSAEV